MDVQEQSEASSNRRVWIRSAAATAGCLVLGWFAFVRGTNVPLLSGVDLGFHELGHLLTRWLPEVIMLMAGSITQVLVPVGLATYFLWKRRDLVAGGLCLAWAATSAQNASVYIADAPYERLQLIGGLHDWATVLGPEHFNMLGSAHAISVAVYVTGLGMFVAGLALCCAGPIVERGRQRTRQQAEWRLTAAGKGSSQGWSVVPPWEGAGGDVDGRPEPTH